MKTKFIACAIAGAFLMTPLAFGKGLLPLNPLVNGDFDTYITPGMAAVLQPVADHCFGVGHQAVYPYKSEWAAYILKGVNDPPWLVQQAQDDPNGTAGNFTGYPVAYAGEYAAAPKRTYECDPDHKDQESVNAWEASRDQGLGWGKDASTQIKDYSGDGDREAVFGTDSSAFLYQSYDKAGLTQQAWSADFDSFDFTLEAGNIRNGAEIEIPFSLTPGYMQSPYVGIFYEGFIHLNVTNQMALDGNGHVQLDPIADGYITCPKAYPPCETFKDAYYNTNNTSANQHKLLGEIRLLYTKFLNFGDATEHVVIDDVAYIGAKTMVETEPNPNPGA
ncbi:MAG: hypothetical protein WDA16_11850 [Candidatus Thermoplasmatota archaeon]